MRAILFDLDGTIINSEEGITKCVQYALKAYGVDEPDLKKLLCFIGPPLEPVFQEKYGMTGQEAWEAVEKYRERFDVKGIFECCLYEGVEKVIRSLGKGLCAGTCVLKAGGRVQTHFKAF